MRSLEPVNLSPPERVGRAFVGFLSAGLGGGFLADAGSVLVIGALVLLILAGTYLTLTGLSGRCPIYRRFGHESASLKSYGP